MRNGEGGKKCVGGDGHNAGGRRWESVGGYVRVRREGGELWQQGCEEKVGESDYRRCWRGSKELAKWVEGVVGGI